MKSKTALTILTAIAVLTMVTSGYMSPITVLASSESSEHPDNAGDASSQLAQSDDLTMRIHPEARWEITQGKAEAQEMHHLTKIHLQEIRISLED